MENKLKILFLGTNQFYESPRHIIKNYTEYSNLDNLILKNEGYITFTKKFKKDPTLIKLHEIKNYADGKHDILISEADSLVIIFDLSNYESLYILNQMLIHIKEKCSWSISSQKKIYILGKYLNTSERHPFLTEDAINNYLSESNLYYDYLELCTKDFKDVVRIIDFIILESSETKYRIDMIISKNRKLKTTKEISSNCLIY